MDTQDKPSDIADAGIAPALSEAGGDVAAGREDGREEIEVGAMEAGQLCSSRPDLMNSEWARTDR